jgi:hypothetical protein
MDATLSRSEDHPRLSEWYRGLWSKDQLSHLLSGDDPVQRMKAQLEGTEDLPQLRQRYRGLWSRDKW